VNINNLAFTAGVSLYTGKSAVIPRSSEVRIACTWGAAKRNDNAASTATILARIERGLFECFEKTPRAKALSMQESSLVGRQATCVREPLASRETDRILPTAVNAAITAGSQITFSNPKRNISQTIQALETKEKTSGGSSCAG
jgi:hypothetical protein